MKRDMDLIREILLMVEKSKTPLIVNDLDLSEYDKFVVKYHVGLMNKAGLITATDGQPIDDDIHLINGLTWDGGG